MPVLELSEPDSHSNVRRLSAAYIYVSTDFSRAQMPVNSFVVRHKQISITEDTSSERCRKHYQHQCTQEMYRENTRFTC